MFFSAIDVVTKLSDPEFLRKAKITDSLGRTWDLLREAGGGSGDAVMDMALATFIAFIAQDPRALSELSSKSDFDTALDALLKKRRVLERSNGAKQTGGGKSEQKSVRLPQTGLIRSV